MKNYSMTKEEYFTTLRGRWSHGTLANAALMTYLFHVQNDQDADTQLRDAGTATLAMMEGHNILSPDLTVYEIGCGCGRVATALSEYLTAGRYVGVDLSPQYINICKRRAPLGHFHVTDGCSFPLPDSSADLVIEFSIFCHMPLQLVWRWLQETRRVLKPNGTTYLQFHNLKSEQQWDEFAASADGWKFLDLGHPRSVTLDTVIALFAKAGMEILRMEEVDKDAKGEPNSWMVVAAREALFP